MPFNFRHRWHPSTLHPEQFGPQRSCLKCGLLERTDVGPMNRKVHVWQWMHETREFRDMPTCPGDDPRRVDPYTLKLALGNCRTQPIG